MRESFGIDDDKSEVGQASSISTRRRFEFMVANGCLRSVKLMRRRLYRKASSDNVSSISSYSTCAQAVSVAGRPRSWSMNKPSSV